MSAEQPPANVEENTTAELPQQEEEDVGFKVFVGNLSFQTTEDELADFFAPAGTVYVSYPIFFLTIWREREREREDERERKRERERERERKREKERKKKRERERHIGINSNLKAATLIR